MPEVADICASFQRVVVKTLVERTFTAAQRYDAKSVGVAGGVSANSRLRADIKAYGDAREIPTFVPEPATVDRQCRDDRRGRPPAVSAPASPRRST